MLNVVAVEKGRHVCYREKLLWSFGVLKCRIRKYLKKVDKLNFKMFLIKKNEMIEKLTIIKIYKNSKTLKDVNFF